LNLEIILGVEGTSAEISVHFKGRFLENETESQQFKSSALIEKQSSRLSPILVVQTQNWKKKNMAE
jgi:hypothetical protein